jgi:hypothetical protein
MDNKEDNFIAWEAPEIIAPEFRLYYEKDTGKVICYTCEKPEGSYIIIDANTYAQARPDVRIIDGKISTVQTHFVVSKLMPTASLEGQLCEDADVSVISTDDEGTIKWKLNTYELK